MNKLQSIYSAEVELLYKDMKKKRRIAALVIGSVEQCMGIQMGIVKHKTKFKALCSVGGCTNCPFSAWDTCDYYKSLLKK